LYIFVLHFGNIASNAVYVSLYKFSSCDVALISVTMITYATELPKYFRSTLSVCWL